MLSSYSKRHIWRCKGDARLTTWFAGMLITADRLNDGIDATVATSGLTASSGFSVNDFEGKISGQICTIDVYLSVTSTINTTSGTSSNIADTTCCTLPAAYRPASHMVEAIWDNGTASGGATIDTTGVITLRTSDYNQPISSGSNIRIHAAFIL